MRRRALQLALLIVLGGAAGFLLTHDWNATKPAAAVPTLAVERSVPAVETPKKAADVSPPPARTFKLPAMPPPAPAPLPILNKEPPLPTVTRRVPRFWELRGSGPENYRLLSDNEYVVSGGASAVIRSKPDNVAVTLDGGLMQTVDADSLVGRRLEVSAFVRAEDVRARTVAVSFTALGENNELIVTASSAAEFPKIEPDWTRVRLVVDVPQSAVQVRYGVVLTGSGSVWVDDFRLTTVDPNVVALSSTTPPRQFGQRVVAVKDVLHQPENLDFEETADIRVPAREKEASVTAIRQ